MKILRGIKNQKGISLIEVMVAAAIFLLFALGIYSGIQIVMKIVYSSRLRILETAILDEKLEVVRNLPFEQVGILNGIPVGVLPYSQTTTRNGIDFNIITTVRNIDDAFDGMATGTIPVDTSPADYKLVEMSIICASCIQKKPVILSTRVSPLGLEGASDNGSLFVHVFDNSGLDVSGATINVTYIGSSTINFTDVTDNDGMLRIVDTPTGTEAYHINVSKSGYSSDYSVSSSLSNPNPDKPPSTVITQMVTEISYSIDELADFSLTTVDPSCSALGNIFFDIRGEKTIGHNPIVYKYDQNLNTNASGFYNFGGIEWDKYHLSTTGTSYDLIGTVPALPIDLTPGLTQEAVLVVQPHSSYSLLVLVRDAGTLYPLSSSTVRLTKGGYDKSLVTSIGYMRQTDWSNGSGQTNYSDQAAYYVDDGNIDNDSPDGTIKLEKTGHNYQSSGWLESSTFNIGSNATYRNIVWEPLIQTASTSVKFQLATSNSSTISQWNFIGPDGTDSTYYTTTNTLINDIHNNQSFMRYRVYLETEDSSKTAQVSEVLFTYTNQCTPPGQVFFDNLSSGTYTLEVDRDGYESLSDYDVEITGNNEAIIDLSTSI